MAWDYIDKSFPLGKIKVGDNNYFDNKELKQSDIKIIKIPLTLNYNNMIIEKRLYVWDEKGNFAILKDYDINDLIPHPPNIIYPLNIFGTHMLHDYYTVNNIDPDKIPRIIEDYNRE